MKKVAYSHPKVGWWVALLLMIALIVVIAAAIVVLVDNSSSSSADGDAPSFNGSRVTDSLKLVIVVSRHGNRGGLEDYPMDPYPLDDVKYWPYGTNELTPYGRTQLYNLGLKLRSMYNMFLGVPYIRKEFVASSTSVERVVMSGELVLAGLFKPFGFQVWNEHLPWQPVPIYSNSTDKSPVIGKCARYQEEKAKVYNKFLEKDAANITALTDYVANVTGATVDTDTLYFMFDKLISEDLEGYAIPEWAQKIYPSPLDDFYGKDYLTYFAGSDEIVRLLIGSFFGEILSAFASKVNGDALASRKMYYYSSHDTTIVALQALLGIPKPSIIKVVHPGSAMIIELHQDPTSSLYYIQVLYIDGSSSDLEPNSLSLPTCGEPCYYDSLLNITHKFVITDYDAECLTSIPNSTYSSSSTPSASTEPVGRRYFYT